MPPLYFSRHTELLLKVDCKKNHASRGFFDGFRVNIVRVFCHIWTVVLQYVGDPIAEAKLGTKFEVGKIEIASNAYFKPIVKGLKTNYGIRLLPYH